MPITLTFEQVAQGATTDPLVYEDPYDVWVVYATNPNPVGINAYSNLGFEGDFLQLGDLTFKNGAGLEVSFGIEIPDTFFVLRTNENRDILGVIDTPAKLFISGYTSRITQGHVSAESTEPIATISTPAGTPFGPANFLGGNASVAGVFVPFVAVPEPTAAALAAFTCLVAASRLRPRRG